MQAKKVSVRNDEDNSNLKYKRIEVDQSVAIINPTQHELNPQSITSQEHITPLNQL
jgi:hypothetical protein